MNTCSVQRIGATCNTHEASALFKCLRSKLGYLQKFFSACETSILFTVSYNVLSDCFGNTGNILQKGSRCCIQIYANLINRILNHTSQGFTQLLLVHVMLILSNTNGFRIDLNQFSQRILHTSCNGSGTSLSYVKIREFFCCKLTCRINRSTSLICDHILNLCLWDLLQHIYDHLLRLSGSSTISNRDQGNMIFPDHGFYGILCSADLLLIGRRSRVNNCSIQNFSSRIYNSQLTAGTESRIPAKDSLPCDWRLHKKLLQVLAKDFDSTVFCLLCQVTSDLTLDCRRNKTLVAVLCYLFQDWCGKRVFTGDHLLLQVAENIFLRCCYLNSKEFLFLTAVQRQHTMSSQLLHRLFKFVIHFVNRLCLRILCHRTDGSFLCSKVTDVDSVICLVGNMLCNNILRTSNGVCHRSNLFFL